MTNLLRRLKCWLEWHEWNVCLWENPREQEAGVDYICKHCGVVK